RLSVIVHTCNVYSLAEVEMEIAKLFQNGKS
ncbi:MAG: hypothetical protein RLZZ387_4071, partial [Chloroflexota bacterium]